MPQLELPQQKIGGSTLHSTFKLRQKNLQIGSNAYTSLCESLGKVRYVLVDEISMLDAKTLQFVNSRLQWLHGNTSPFGNINVLLLGDFYQFPPVLNRPLYEDRLVVNATSNSECDEALGRLLWHLFDRVIILKNFRQDKDTRWLQILRNFLAGRIAQEDIDLIRSRVIKEGGIEKVDIFIVNRNSTRQYLNRKILDGIIARRGVNSVTFKAIDKCSSRMIDHEEIKDFLLELRDDQTESLPGKLKIFGGMRVMITTNVCPRLGVANGTIGTIYAVPPSDKVDYLQLN